MAARERAVWGLALTAGMVGLFLGLRSNDPTQWLAAIAVALLVLFSLCRRALEIRSDEGDM